MYNKIILYKQNYTYRDCRYLRYAFCTAVSFGSMDM